MKTIDPIETWITTVAYSHSNSPHTRINYIHHFNKFERYAETTAQEIIQDYNKCKTDKEF